MDRNHKTRRLNVSRWEKVAAQQASPPRDGASSKRHISRRALAPGSRRVVFSIRSNRPRLQSAASAMRLMVVVAALSGAATSSGLRPPSPRGRRVAGPLTLGLALPLMLLLLLAGCGRDEDLDAVYGKSSGVIGGNSVNGTAVLAELFTQQGHTVIGRRYLTPTVQESADTIVWAPNDRHPPSDEVIEWFDDWLWNEPNRKLIYIGRDYDAAVTYWEKVIPGAPAEQQAEMRRRLNAAKARDSSMHGGRTRDTCDWFELDGALTGRQVVSMQGAWSQGIDASQVDIVIRDRLAPNPVFLDEVLLSSEGDAVVSRYSEPHWAENSDAIFIVNGSFLLNLPLVNHEHRKLAGKLVDEVGGPSGTVVFLESGAGGPQVLDRDPSTKIPTGLEQFTVWPQNIVLLHLAAAGIIFCFARWPIFGRAKRPPRSQAADFGQHVAAVGELLEATGDHDFAKSRHAQYHQTMHQSSFGVTRDAPRPPRPPDESSDSS